MTKTEHILIVEDDANDALLIQRAFAQNGIQIPPYVCVNGLDAVDYLNGEGEYGDRGKFPFPDVLITDLKMPRMDGFGLLTWLAEHPEMQVIPTVVISSSAMAEDVKRAYCLGANAYIQKPSNATEFKSIIGDLLRFWARCESPKLKLPCAALLSAVR
jgi:CheY-like chemotaxis protein